MSYLGDKSTCKAKLCNSPFQPVFCRTVLYSSTVICRRWLCQARGAGLVMPVKKSIHFPWEKAAEVPTALPLWLNFPVSNWYSLNWTGIQFCNIDIPQNHGTEREPQGSLSPAPGPAQDTPKSHSGPAILFAMTSMALPCLAGWK